MQTRPARRPPHCARMADGRIGNAALVFCLKDFYPMEFVAWWSGRPTGFEDGLTRRKCDLGVPPGCCALAWADAPGLAETASEGVPNV